MNLAERFFIFTWLFLCVFYISLIPESRAEEPIFNVAELCNLSSNVDLRNFKYGILTAQVNAPVDCELFLGRSYYYSIVISFMAFNLERNDILTFTDIDGTELSLSYNGNYRKEKKSFIFEPPVTIHFASNQTTRYRDLKFRLGFTESHGGLCEEDEFKCDNQLCIPALLVCNGHNNCGDRSDERDCNEFCRSEEFQCQNKRCIPKYKSCDGADDCGDMSDERNCYSHCSSDEFKCDNRKCIPKYKLCNKNDDCGDRSDERNCSKCLSTEFECNNRKCIPKFFVCDKFNDCGDMSDERDCRVEDNRYSETVLPLTSNPWLITIIVCGAILALIVIIFSAVLIKRCVTGNKKSPDTQLPTVSGQVGVQHVQPPNLFGRIRQSFRSGRQSAPPTQPPYSQREPHVSEMQNYKVPSMYPPLQTGVDNPEFKIEE